MRAIKFRAWDKQNKQWTEISSMHYTSAGIFVGNGHGELIDGDFELMQYTGLKDKNGVEIYEGDILKHSGTRYDGMDYSLNHAVEWSWDVGYDDPGIGYNLSSQDAEESEVIGNIYENPELISKGKK